MEAYWEDAREGLILLQSDWLDESAKPPLFLDPGKRPFKELRREDPLTFARLSGYYRPNSHHEFIVVEEDFPRANLGEADLLVACPANDWEPEKDAAKWTLKPDRVEGHPVRRLRVPSSLVKDGEPFPFKFKTSEGQWLYVSWSAPNAVPGGFGTANLEFHSQRTGHHVFRFVIPDDFHPVGSEAVLWVQGEETERHPLPPTEDFFGLASAAELGARIADGATTFRLFAPRASGVAVLYWRQPDRSDETSLALTRGEDGVWEGKVPEVLDGAFYIFRVEGTNLDHSTHFDSGHDILDPYARAVVNRSGPGIVIADERFANGPGQLGGRKVTDLVVMEIHPRDVLAHAPCELEPEERLGFRGLTRWMEDSGGYLRSLGVNAIELQPVQEFDNESPEEYHWGYMPVNWFAPESSYGSDPMAARQIEEFREWVDLCHRQGISVILDVVYNHLGEPNHLIFVDKLYYFETDHHHFLLNFSGCGNDFRASTPMGKRLIIESLRHWITAYGVDGFRFDLAELLGLETLREIEQAIRSEFPDTILIAEPWSFRGSVAEPLRSTSFTSWNDRYREFLPDFVWGEGDGETLRHLMEGSLETAESEPRHSLNYSESHDDYCWLDRITENPDHNGFDPTSRDQRRTHLMLAILLASQGVPMLAGGMDFLRSKHGVHNTYQRGDLNAFDYHRLLYFSQTHQYAREWIGFRLGDTGGLLRLDHRPSAGFFKWCFGNGNSAAAVLLNADQSEGAGQLIFAVNPTLENAEIAVEGWEWDDFVQVADTFRFQSGGLKPPLYSCWEGGLLLPGLSCGLWKTKEST